MILSSDDLVLAQPPDLRVREAKLAQHFARVLAAVGRRRYHSARRATEGDRLAKYAKRAAGGGHDLAHDPEVLHLRIREDLIDGMDRPAGHTGLVQAFDPLGAGPATEIGLDLDIERIAVCQARRGGGGLGLVHPGPSS